jgi:hypothetical protein
MNTIFHQETRWAESPETLAKDLIQLHEPLVENRNPDHILASESQGKKSLIINFGFIKFSSTHDN